VAERLDVDPEQTREVGQVALLHDIGKIGVPDSILQKPGPLTESEWAVMRTHPAVGAEMVSCVVGLGHLAPAVRAEHERWDGCGYPDGLRGEDIPLSSRIVFACDAFHAMTSDRPYRRALSREAAVAELERGSGSQFCPTAVKALLEEIAPLSEDGMAVPAA
jgi:HD-GYP domain-containing protein (c-di-GMP phosphodiesterase class II)